MQSKRATRKGSCIVSESRLGYPRDNLNELVRKNRSGTVLRYSSDDIIEMNKSKGKKNHISYLLFHVMLISQDLRESFLCELWEENARRRLTSVT